MLYSCFVFYRVFISQDQWQRHVFLGRSILISSLLRQTIPSSDVIYLYSMLSSRQTATIKCNCNSREVTVVLSMILKQSYPPFATATIKPKTFVMRFKNSAHTRAICKSFKSTNSKLLFSTQKTKHNSNYDKFITKNIANKLIFIMWQLYQRETTNTGSSSYQ